MKKLLYQKKLHSHPNVFCIVSSSQYWLTSTFLRIQEFYESPLKPIKGHHFTLEEFSDLYAETYGNFTYHTEWAGFNIPGHIVRKFFQKFNDLSKKEETLKQILDDALNSTEKFYVIGILKDNNTKRVLKHELTHAMYYLDDEFRKEMNDATNNMDIPTRKFMMRKLKEMGYSKHVIKDEIQAYLSTSPSSELRKLFERNIHPKHTEPFRKIHRRYHEI